MHVPMKVTTTLIVLAGFFLAACSPSTPAEMASAPEAATGGQTDVSPAGESTSPPPATQPLPSPTLAEPSVEPVVPTETEAQAIAPTDETPLPVAEAACPDRGPELHASDPESVELASGKVQLVEFFAFW